MRCIINWFKRLFKEEVTKTEVKKVRYLINELKPENADIGFSTVTIMDVASLSVKVEEENVGVGNAIVTGLTIDDSETVNSEVFDLELVNGSIINDGTVIEAKYVSLGYDISTNQITHDIVILLSNARLVNGNKIICHKNDAQIIVTKREAVA